MVELGLELRGSQPRAILCSKMLRPMFHPFGLILLGSSLAVCLDKSSHVLFLGGNLCSFPPTIPPYTHCFLESLKGVPKDRTPPSAPNAGPQACLIPSFQEVKLFPSLFNGIARSLREPRFQVTYCNTRLRRHPFPL